MRSKYALFLAAAISVFSLAVLPGRLQAITLTVNPSDPTCGTTSNPNCRTTIAGAISAAVSGDSVLVEPDTYHERITLRSDIAVSLRGRETARTILTGDGTGTIITANGVTVNTSISGFTFTSALVGIDVFNNSTLTLVNNVFSTGLGGIGVRVQNTNSALVTIRNSTFYQNLTAVSSNTVMTIMNNIFANNTTAISSQDIATTNITFNCFFSNGTGGVFGETTNNVTGDPQFVSPAKPDFHLKEGSPCIDAGNSDPLQNDSIDNTSRNDMGAYGGPSSDTIPYPVLVSSPTATGDAITMSWAANLSSVVTSTNPAKQGGYKIYYSLGQSGQSGINYLNTLTLASTITSTVITGLTTSISPAGAPALNPLGFDNQTLLVSWASVSNATGYKVHYALSTDLTNSLHTAVIQDTSYKLVSLTNGTNYTVWVTAVTQPVYYFAVTAFDSTPGPFSPGLSHESAYSPEVSVTLGSLVESLPSNEVTGFPEAYVYNPNLPNKGCFIATAAYGYYDAPQVQALRDFRDRYLETNSAGRAFVRWYYEYGPIGAAVLNERPWLKPIVRTALRPAVGGALFLASASTVTQLMGLCLFILMIAMLVIYKKNIGHGGPR